VKSFSKEAIKRTIFGNFYDFETYKVNKYYAFQVTMRACGLMITYYCAIKSIYYAGLANLNFGIVSCCFIFSIIINVTCGLLFFDENINWKESAGIVVIVAGIIWISLSKGQRLELSSDNSVEADEAIQWYKFKSIFLALCVGFFNST
jgi:drug/metabolite transporter (DMT)-like permease